MNVKHLFLSSLVLVPALCKADAMLNISLTVDETTFEIENVTVSEENAVLFDNGYTKVEGKLIGQTDEAVEFELKVMEEDRVLTQPTLNVQWGIPATLELTYESEDCSCLDRDVILVVVAQPVA